MTKFPLWILAGIFLLGAFFRLNQLSPFPPSLNWDEASLGYNAYSLLKTGRDEWGVVFPTIFRAFGDYKLPGYVYFTVPAVWIFGLTPAAVHLASALSGLLSILVIYLLAWHLFKSRVGAAVSAWLLAVSPWSILLSRIAVEANLALLFSALGVYLLLLKRPNWAILFLGLSAWTYNSARVFAPGIFLAYLFIRHFRLPLRSWILAGCLFLPLFWQLFSPSGLARFTWVSLLDSGAVNRINALRANSSLPDPFPRLIFNKVTYFSLRFTSNYLAHFSPQFLFLQGGSHYQFNIPGVGLLSLVNLPFFYFGLVLLLFSPKPVSPLLRIWLLLGPVAGSLTRDAPHTLRAVTFLIPVMLVSSQGVSSVLTYFNSWGTRLVYLFFGLSAASLAVYWLVSVPRYVTDYSWAWQYGNSQLVSELKDQFAAYDQIFITKKYGEPHIFILFYWPWDPLDYQSDPRLVRYLRTDWYWVDSFSKFHFVNDWEMSAITPPDLGQKYLVVGSPDNPPAGTPVSQINFLNGQPAYILKAQ